MAVLSEAELELALMEQFGQLGYGCENDASVGPDSSRPERESHDETILRGRLEAAVERINPHLPVEARNDAIRKVLQTELPSLVEENRRLHKLIVDGVDVEYFADDGVLTSGKVAPIDFDEGDNNDWLIVN